MKDPLRPLWLPQILSEETAMRLSADRALLATMENHEWHDYAYHIPTTPERYLRILSSFPADRVLAYFKTSLHGLDACEISRRQGLVGQKNVLSVRKPHAWWKVLLWSVPNPFNILLVLLAVIAVATPSPSWANFAILVVMVVLSCGIRFWQEYKGAKAVVRLQACNSSKVMVRRPGRGEEARFEKTDLGKETEPWKEEKMRVKDLVPGDVILLRPGHSVPADCLILQANRLLVSQSGLTGESEPVKKTAEASAGTVTDAIFDLKNIAFMGTGVISGTGLGLVLTTGDRVLMAGITQELDERKPATAFDAGLRRFSYLMIGFMAIMVPIVLIIRGTLSKDWGSATFYSLSVAVGLVPEMLPAILNTNLARGSRRLAKKGAIVKTLGAVQNLGSMTVLCCDKTGTLTKDKITLESAESFSGKKSLEVLKLAYTNALHQSGLRNDVDEAILRSKPNGLSDQGLLGKCIHEIPFDFERRRSSALFARETSDHATLICKGAVEEMISLCTQMRKGRRVVDLQESDRLRFLKQVHAYNDDGYRVLAVASRTLPKHHLNAKTEHDLERDMILEGILKFLDPPRDDAESAIAKLQELGVEVKILTGDSVRIALKLCRSLKIVSDDVESMGSLRAVTGPELAKLSPSDFHAAVSEASVLAKLTPTQKGAVVRALKEGGRSVGMLGDGINDCIALSVADVGMTVNNAVSVAKDCADIILTEKRLRTVVSAICIGRTTHGNTIKYIKMVASSNFGNVLSLLVASAWLPYQPMTPLQIVLQNLLYDLSQMATPWDAMDAEYLATPHSWDMRDTLRFVVCLGPTSSIIDITTFLISWFYFGVRTSNDTAGVAQVQAHWFLQGLLTQVLIVHVLRTAEVPFVKSSSRAAGPLAFATMAVAGIGFATPFIPPLGHALGMGFPAKEFIGFLAAELVGYCVLVQVVKMLYIRLTGRWL